MATVAEVVEQSEGHSTQLVVEAEDRAWVVD
jgi:hypothetical protein